MKLKYQLCDFDALLPNGKKMDKRSMEKILESTDFQERMRTHDMMGTISHKMRWDVEESKKKSDKLPQSDLLFLNGEAANCTEKLWIEDNKLICELQVLHTGLGKRVEDTIKLDKIYPDVSMVVRQDIVGDTIILKDFIGVDFTFNPALQTELLGAYSKSVDASVNTYAKFMVNPDSDTTSILVTNSKCEIIEDEEKTDSLESYSLREFIRVRNRKPIQALLLIITDIKTYLRTMKVEDIKANRRLILEYLTTYLFTKITEILTDPSIKVVNLVMVLGLNRFADMAAINEFQRVANLLLRERKAMGFLSKRMQTLLTQATNKLVKSILKNLVAGLPEDKQALFIEMPEKKTGEKSEEKVK